MLPERYTALLNEWYVTATPEAEEGSVVASNPGHPRAYIADLGTFRSESGSARAAVAVPPPMRLTTMMPTPLRQVTVDVREVANRLVVTTIEVLSAENKSGEGRREYLRKRRQLVLLSSAHLIEIDLLRRGRRVPMREALPSAPYFVFLSRVNTRPVVDVWPIQLRQQLPTIPVPLLGDDPDVSLDLQKAFTAMFDGLRLDRNVDYSRPPRVTLESEDADWAAERVKLWRNR